MVRAAILKAATDALQALLKEGNDQGYFNDKPTMTRLIQDVSYQKGKAVNAGNMQALFSSAESAIFETALRLMESKIHAVCSDQCPKEFKKRCDSVLKTIAGSYAKYRETFDRYRSAG